jgi:threonylcarbamoyladenosine tRNA methylthiotransferase MtaB
MNIFLDSIGCRLNQAEIEQIAVKFKKAGHNLVGTAAEADLVVVNTCAVTAEAGSDSRQRIRQAVGSGHAEVIATGCLSTLEGSKLLQLPRVILNIPNIDKDLLVEACLIKKGEEKEHVLFSRQPIPGRRERTRAFIKAQDGCDNHCTFCITRLVRGKSKSISENTIVAEIQNAVDGGAKEIILCGVQLGAWGQELYPKKKLTDLVQRVLGNTSIPRVRLSSIEPWNLDKEFFHLWANPRMCRQLHMPLQSGSNEILEAMGRGHTKEEYEELIAKARSICPEIAITTDILVGFPGEGDVNQKETMDFVEKIRFAGGHVFPFSPRPGTTGEKLPDQVPPSIKKERSREIRNTLSQSAKAYFQLFLGENLQTLWEKTELLPNHNFLLEGWTDNYLKVAAISKHDLHNQFSLVKLFDPKGKRINGRICG